MSNFSPYKIINWYIDQPVRLSNEKGKTYVCCWWNQLPLGHVWWEKDTSWNDINQSIKDSIRPTLDFYLQNNTAYHAQLLQNEAYAQLSMLLEEHFSGGKTDTVSGVSVIICTKQRPEALKSCLTQLSLCSENFEVIVVDNSPGFPETKIVAELFPNVKYIPEARGGLDVARNTGARHAKNEIIAYTDDDVTVPSNWIENISRAFHHPLTMAITGLVIPQQLQTEAQYIFEKKWSFNKGYLPKIFDHNYIIENAKWGAPVWEIGAGANMAFRKKAFQLAGYFDERLDAGAAGCSGDSEMWFRVLAEGWNCEYLPHIFVFHQHRNTMPELKNQLFNYMKGHVAALFIQNEKYPSTGNLQRVYRGLPLYYIPKLLTQLFKNKRNKEKFLTQQIKGCFAGWNFYKQHRNEVQPGIKEIPAQLAPGGKNFKDAIVSVVITCYNLGHYLNDAIESVLKQTHSNREIIVVDDGSTDNTAEVAGQFKDSIRFIKANRVGLSAARNIGAQLSRGDYIVFLDADDFLYPQALEINGYFFSYYPQMQMVSGAHTLVNAAGKETERPTFKTTINNNYLSLLHGNYIAMEGAVMYRRGIFEHFHFDTSLKACEDYDLNLKIARLFPVFGHDKIIAAYRKHGNNMSDSKIKMKEYALMVLKRQQPLLKTEEEKMAWENGMKNWGNYYKK
jgi:glycosyltransferase involved in cell wall biosynthesis